MKIGDLFIKLVLQKGEFDKGIDDAKQQTSAFANGIKAVGSAIAGAFAVSSIVQFGKEVFNIATQAQGIQTAFFKIANEANMDMLRESVKGTVSDLELMKRAVLASNFGIPVKELGKLFEFASKRAQDTGQSIDYLVDSIVIGIGRKSPLILDNLGISIVDLRKRLNGVSAETATIAQLTKVVGDIAEESFKKTGRLAENLGTSVQTLTASWENFKLSLSSIFSNSGLLKTSLDNASSIIQTWASKNVPFFIKLLATLTPDAAIRARFQAVIESLKLVRSEGEKLKESNKKEVVAPKQDPIVLTAVEQLAAIKKVNEELEAQRILRQEFKGEKMTEAPVRYNEAGDFQLGVSSIDAFGGGVFGNLDSHYEKIKEKRKKFTDEELKGWTDFTDQLDQTIASGIGDAIGSLAEGLGQLAAGEISGGEFGKQILSVIGGFMKTLGGLMIAYAVNMALFSESAKNPMAWPVALAAGIGLVAAGAAISSFASKGVSGGAASTTAASGYSNYSASSGAAVLSGNVVFELEGTKLRGALNNTDRRNTLIR